MAQNIRLLQVEAAKDQESDLRILVDDKHIKYLIIEPGVYSTDDICFAPALMPLLPILPQGDWNEIRIAADPKTKKPFVKSAQVIPFDSVNYLWHPTIIEYLDLTFHTKIRSNMYQVTNPTFSVPVIAKFARWNPEVAWIEEETRAYEWLAGHGIGPEFLGYIAEHGRLIGFLMEQISNFKHAQTKDLELCKKALAKLHALGMVM